VSLRSPSGSVKTYSSDDRMWEAYISDQGLRAHQDLDELRVNQKGELLHTSDVSGDISISVYTIGHCYPGRRLWSPPDSSECLLSSIFFKISKKLFYAAKVICC